MKNTVLETERLILRHWEESDAEECYKYAKDPRVGPPAGWPPHKSVEESRNVIREVLSGDEIYAIVLKETGLPVGSIGLHFNSDLAHGEGEAELGYWIGVPYWGRGLVPEAGRAMLRRGFSDLGLERIWCGYYDGNDKSRRVQEKLGFKYQWTTEDAPVLQMDETRKGHVNCMTKEDWIASRGVAGAAVYVHGQGGSAGEAGRFGPLFPDLDVIGFDYGARTPWEARAEFPGFLASIRKYYKKVVLVANSIGAFFAMSSGAGTPGVLDRAFFISPVVDMEELILGMMDAAGVSEDELKEKGTVETGAGTELSWEYLKYVRETPVEWETPTEILYGSCDELTPFETVKRFAREHGAGLTVMEGGEHWFHTPEQLRFLDQWVKEKYVMDNHITDKEDPVGGTVCVNGRECVIRAEGPEDYRAVEELVRESFWNVYRPGASEHFVIHVLRDDPAFVMELDVVMELDGRLIGQNMFMRTVIDVDGGGTKEVLTMGPICVANDLKRQGYGKALLDRCLEMAASMGFGAVLFEGNIGFYGKCGFDYASKFGIRYHDLPEGADASFFLCKELVPGYLDGVRGVYQTPAGYYVDDGDVEEFDRGFPPREKLKLPGQLF
jgi:RimJ/RimL family protein N-acetyltransferase/predicted N-acetyltransferase YhbS